jgi:tritrans,polycis-undecaprenyl-diphosphate synthase [geranylgeranyl-diphosphate specific]
MFVYAFMEKVPRHIGVIVDGNRRFAKRLMLKPWMGHEWGAGKFRKFLDWCFELGVEEVTAYAFSIQNFNRPKEEFDFLMRVFKAEFERFLSVEGLAELRSKGTRIRVIGRLWMLPEEIQLLARNLTFATKDFGNKSVNLAIAYGGREEIIDAVQRIAVESKEGKLDPLSINEKSFGRYLSLNSDPDLIIRTGGERRTSNFLPWQSTYSELIFLEKFWPELEKEDLVNCFVEFASRDRRFGK